METRDPGMTAALPQRDRRGGPARHGRNKEPRRSGARTWNESKMKMCASDTKIAAVLRQPQFWSLVGAFLFLKPLDYQRDKESPGRVVPGLKDCDGNT
jgi:hypothetical protein